MTPRGRAALVTGSVAVCVYLLRRAFVRRRVLIDAGSVSSEWLAQQRGVIDHFTLG
jgi:hypothetical protein